MTTSLAIIPTARAQALTLVTAWTGDAPVALPGKPAASPALFLAALMCGTVIRLYILAVDIHRLRTYSFPTRQVASTCTRLVIVSGRAHRRLQLKSAASTLSPAEDLARRTAFGPLWTIMRCGVST